jgi:hypothetical protein
VRLRRQDGDNPFLVCLDAGVPQQVDLRFRLPRNLAQQSPHLIASAQFMTLAVLMSRSLSGEKNWPVKLHKSFVTRVTAASNHSGASWWRESGP